MKTTLQTSESCKKLFIERSFSKKRVIQSFKRNFYCDFNINCENNTISVETDLALEFRVPFKTATEKRNIYAFLRYLANCFDFSYTLEFYEYEKLQF